MDVHVLLYEFHPNSVMACDRFVLLATTCWGVGFIGASARTANRLIEDVRSS